MAALFGAGTRSGSRSLSGGESTMSGAEPEGFDQIAALDEKGRKRFYTRSEFEDLPPAERVRMLMNGKTEFYRGAALITAREALHGK